MGARTELGFEVYADIGREVLHDDSCFVTRAGICYSIQIDAISTFIMSGRCAVCFYALCQVRGCPTQKLIV